MGFSPLVNQRLLAPTFPRFTKIKDRDDSLAFLEEMVQRIRTTGKVIKCQNFHSALVSVASTQFGIFSVIMLLLPAEFLYGL